ncbi:hypothetical protein PBAL39_22927 [Pedobacter sp. BAL39]|nr:hypothetical protein PBAL39_22927 [Pedobacter sp. BAL39]
MFISVNYTSTTNTELKGFTATPYDNLTKTYGNILFKFLD